MFFFTPSHLIFPLEHVRLVFFRDFNRFISAEIINDKYLSIRLESSQNIFYTTFFIKGEYHKGYLFHFPAFHSAARYLPRSLFSFFNRSDQSRRVSSSDLIAGNIPGYHRAGADNRSLPDDNSF
jgi:hypothetical protein